jgi:hypothetical protein
LVLDYSVVRYILTGNQNNAPKPVPQKLTDLRRTKPARAADDDEEEDAKPRSSKKAKTLDARPKAKAGADDAAGEDAPKKNGAGTLGSMIGRKRKQKKMGKS